MAEWRGAQWSPVIELINTNSESESLAKLKHFNIYIYIYIYTRGLSHKLWQLYFSSRTGENTENLRYAFEKVWYVLAYDTTRWCM